MNPQSFLKISSNSEFETGLLSYAAIVKCDKVGVPAARKPG